MTIPRVIISIETEGRPTLKLEASDEDLGALLLWLSEDRVRTQLAQLLALVTGETLD